MLRTFSFQDFDRYDQDIFLKEKEEAQKKIMTEKKHNIIATDIDEDMIKMAKLNAKNA
ncbi:hypothetical protein KKG31_02925 [Patescibacteria group bacterium]|nr:hypothetical protein [Patescibacteria group bacterium]MBU1758115.1 hypothetical protein [Patescibacteria group bacterium]